MDRVNVDYIGVVRKSADNRFDYIKVPIENEHKELLGILKDMIANPNMTVLDMQGHFNQVFRNTPAGYNYCYPYSYLSSYIYGAHYPTSYTYQEYQDKLQECNDRESRTKSLKEKFEKESRRYIQALCYNKKIEHLKQDDRNKMFSSENIGWTNYEYEINSDIQFRLKTNFGYGMSSYFLVNLTYKGIDILPYSTMVTYYYANMADIIRYTRLYDPQPDSWNIALDFVTRTTNEAIANPSAFAHHWIMNEIQMLMTGLKRFAENRSAAFNSILCKKEIGGLIMVRNINQSEEKQYKIYPYETELAKQAEKITGALDILTNLESLSEIFPEISHSIQTIKDLNIDLLPSFIRGIEEIGNEIERRQSVVIGLEKELELLEQFCKPHDDLIQKLKKEKEAQTGKSVFSHQIREEYYKEHMDYKEKYDKLQELQCVIRRKKDDIWNRKRFVMQIESCVDKIRITLQLSA